MLRLVVLVVGDCWVVGTWSRLAAHVNDHALGEPEHTGFEQQLGGLALLGDVETSVPAT
jgi:hypothetical protein